MPDEGNADAQPNNPKGNPLSVTPPQKPTADSDKNDDIELEKDIREGERWLIRIGIASVVINLIIACIYYGQLTQMRLATEASTRAVQLASDSLELNQGDFERSMRQIIHQTKSQIDAANASQSAATAAKGAADTAKEALHVSERAYLVREKIEAEVDHKVITASVENAGHIPTGDIHVVTHLAVVEQVAFAPEGRVRILEADRTESDLPSFPPGIPQKIYFTPQTFDVDRYRMGIQTLVVILTVTYNDGFPDEPDRTLKICAQSSYHPQINMTDFVACNFNATLEKLTKWESDPNPRVVHQQQPNQSEH
jgi:uncharacterized membrane protein